MTSADDIPFQDVIRQWFSSRFDAPTDVQRLAWPSIQRGENLVMAAPTGSGKTLAAFLVLLDRFIAQPTTAEGFDQLQVVYVSPLKSLVNDIQRNLETPLREIRGLAENAAELTDVRVALRTGDTPAQDRRRLIRKPPQVLVTTPESLYILLTSQSGRRMLKTVNTLIVDEIHALAGNKRGSHLSLSVARLRELATGPIQFLGLSATQRPLRRAADFLVGKGQPCQLLDCGHVREIHIDIEVPQSPLQAVMSLDIWKEVYDRLTEHIQGCRSTLIFVHTRRLAERVAHHLEQRLGSGAVAAHHGSLSTERRLDAEQRLKSGQLKALVATASMELGIDVGQIELVCQIGAPRSVSELLQRIGRSGHQVGALPRGLVFPLTRDELLSSMATIRAQRCGDLEELKPPPVCMGVLAQQIVAEVAMQPYTRDALFRLCRSASAYSELNQTDFESVLDMVSQGFSTARGRRGALLVWDKKTDHVRPRRAARLIAVSSGGAIPDTADYRVLLEPKGIQVGTLNEDFAIESMPGDIFALGTSSWRILRVTTGAVRVEDAGGLPPTMPFWFGEAPSRSATLSRALSDFLQAMNARNFSLVVGEDPGSEWAIQQVGDYVNSVKSVLGVLPTADQFIIERFFDASGGMQLVIHAPIGSRINRAWGLALRKRFCRQFNFELQAAATDDAIVISLSEVHAFPLAEILEYLTPSSVRDTLVQALLDAPMFLTRWRWNASCALAVPRRMGGREIPPFIRRMQSEDLIAAVFPDQLACLENISGSREIPDHPLVTQTIEDCLNETMDVAGLIGVLTRIRQGAIRVRCLDLPEPSPLAAEILSAKPYAFLDDAPLEERRTRAAFARDPVRQIDDPTKLSLNVTAIDHVIRDLVPAMEDTDSTYDAVMLMGVLTAAEAEALDLDVYRNMVSLIEDGRVIKIKDGRLVAWENLDAIRSDSTIDDGDQRVLSLLQGVLESRGPLTSQDIAALVGWNTARVETVLARLEGAGRVFRGHFDPRREGPQWCERRVLNRIHRAALDHRRSQVQPIQPACFALALQHWQHLSPSSRMRGVDALGPVLSSLEGFSAPVDVWEHQLLPARISDFQATWLDALGGSGRLAWLRRGGDTRRGVCKMTSVTPIALLARANIQNWRDRDAQLTSLSGDASSILGVLSDGPRFTDELVAQTGLLMTQAERGLSELAARGLATCDHFSGPRALVQTEHQRRKLERKRGLSWYPKGISAAGRWSRVDQSISDEKDRDEGIARALLARYGIVFKRLLQSETNLPPWRRLRRAFWRLEAIGDALGGRFIDGLTGEQFALKEAWAGARRFRQAQTDAIIVVPAWDPCNLTGILPGCQRVPARSDRRIAYRHGEPLAVFGKEGCELLSNVDECLRNALFEHLRPTTRSTAGSGAVRPFR